MWSLTALKPCWRIQRILTTRTQCRRSRLLSRLDYDNADTNGKLRKKLSQILNEQSGEKKYLGPGYSDLTKE